MRECRKLYSGGLKVGMIDLDFLDLVLSLDCRVILGVCDVG